jgi:hypothetical protein
VNWLLKIVLVFCLVLLFSNCLLAQTKVQKEQYDKEMVQLQESVEELKSEWGRSGSDFIALLLAIGVTIMVIVIMVRSGNAVSEIRKLRREFKNFVGSKNIE